MHMLNLVGYALGAALATALTVILFGEVAFGFWFPAWTAQQAAGVGAVATIAGIAAANMFLTRIKRAERLRSPD